MEYKIKTIFTIVILIIFSPTISKSHQGKTDSNGGHYDYFAGEYHYHHGYSAHQHPDSICPYDYDDQTSTSSGTVFTDSVNPTTPLLTLPADNSSALKNDITNLRNKNKELENQINLKQKEIENLKKNKQNSQYLYIGIICITIVYIIYLSKMIDKYEQICEKNKIDTTKL